MTQCYDLSSFCGHRGDHELLKIWDREVVLTRFDVVGEHLFRPPIGQIGMLA